VVCSTFRCVVYTHAQGGTVRSQPLLFRQKARCNSMGFLFISMKWYNAPLPPPPDNTTNQMYMSKRKKNQNLSDKPKNSNVKKQTKTTRPTTYLECNYDLKEDRLPTSCCWFYTVPIDRLFFSIHPHVGV
jgi:hypothetical protein